MDILAHLVFQVIHLRCKDRQVSVVIPALVDILDFQEYQDGPALVDILDFQEYRDGPALVDILDLVD